MRFAMATLLFMAATASSAAFGQDGAGTGPPKIVMLAAQAPAATAGVTITQLFQPRSELQAMTK